MTSNLNFRPGEKVSSGAMVNVGRYGQICAYVHGSGTFTLDLHNSVDDSIF